MNAGFENNQLQFLLLKKYTVTSFRKRKESSWIKLLHDVLQFICGFLKSSFLTNSCEKINGFKFFLSR